MYLRGVVREMQQQNNNYASCTVHHRARKASKTPKHFLRYCAFHKHTNSKVQKPPSQLRFLLPWIIIRITINEPWNTETHKTDRNPPITNHKPWPFEPVKVKFCFVRGPLRWLTAAKNAIVSWLLNFRIRIFVKSTVTPLKVHYQTSFCFCSV